MIGKMNSISFKGAYILKSPSAKTRDDFENVIGKRKQVFNNFNGTNDVLYITRYSADKRIREFLKENEDTIKFCFYPQLSTQSGFDDEKPEEALEKLKKHDIGKITTFRKQKTDISPAEEISTIAKSLRLSQERMKIFQNGVKELVDENGKTTAKISPRNKFGFYYVIVCPKIVDHSHRFLMINSKGVKFREYKTPDEIKQFNEHFKNTLIYAQQCENRNKQLGF